MSSRRSRFCWSGVTIYFGLLGMISVEDLGHDNLEL